MRGLGNALVYTLLSNENGARSYLLGVMAGVVAFLLLTTLLTGCATTKEVLVPTPVPCPQVIIPDPPEYPTLSAKSTPKEVVQYFMLTTALQKDYIQQLLILLKPYAKTEAALIEEYQNQGKIP